MAYFGFVSILFVWRDFFVVVVFACCFGFFFCILNFCPHHTCFSTDFTGSWLCRTAWNTGEWHTAHLCLGVWSSAWRETRFSPDTAGSTPNPHSLSCLGHSQLPLNARHLLVMCHRERLQRIHWSDLNNSWGINYSGGLAFVPKPFLNTMNMVVMRKYLPNSLYKQIAAYG